MNFATDRDLLVLEPNLFRDGGWVGWAGQRLSRGTATIAGSTLTATPDVAFDSASVDAGHILTIAGASYEVTARLSGTQLTLSRVRASPADPALPPSPVPSPAEFVIQTFAPQIAMAHQQILSLAGLERAGSAAALAGAKHEGQVLLDPDLVRLECLGALAIIWSGAAGLLGAGAPGLERAAWFHERFARERQSVRVRLSSGSGLAEEIRSLSAARLSRG